MSASAESNDEKFARLCLERIERVTCSRLDLPGQDGRVDYSIDYPGEPAALEITTLTNSKSREIASTLEATPIVAEPERFAWILTLEPGASLRNARRHVPQLIKLCEAADLRDPFLLPDDEDPAVRWYSSGYVELRGYATGRPPAVHVVPPAVGGLVHNSLGALVCAVDDAFATELIDRKVRKLAAAGLPEQHLFLLVDAGGLEFAAHYGLSVGHGVPSDSIAPPAAVRRVVTASARRGASSRRRSQPWRMVKRCRAWVARGGWCDHGG